MINNNKKNYDQVANMLGATLSKEEVDEFMKEADIVSIYI